MPAKAATYANCRNGCLIWWRTGWRGPPGPLSKNQATVCRAMVRRTTARRATYITLGVSNTGHLHRCAPERLTACTDGTPSDGLRHGLHGGFTSQQMGTPVRPALRRWSVDLRLCREHVSPPARGSSGTRRHVPAPGPPSSATGPRCGTHVVGGLVLGLDAVRMCVGKGIGRRLARRRHRACRGCSPACARGPAKKSVLTRTRSPGLKSLAPRQLVRPGALGRDEGKRAPGPLLQLLPRHHALLDAQRGEAGERALIVAGGQIVARSHALDGVAVLVHVEDAAPDRHAVQRVDALLPCRVKGRRPRPCSEPGRSPAGRPGRACRPCSSSSAAYRRATPIIVPW